MAIVGRRAVKAVKGSALKCSVPSVASKAVRASLSVVPAISASL